jgi:glycine/D-amino acid oxidase-like deaminating enzyme
VVGLDPTCQQIGFFNGLGSKGVITAPSVGEHFASFLTGESDLDPELSLVRVEKI